MSFEFDGDTTTFKGRLDTPVATTTPYGEVKWKVALRAWDLPAFQGNLYDRSFFLIPLVPKQVDGMPLLALSHDIKTAWWRRHIQGVSRRLLWYPVDDTVGGLNSGITDVEILITTYDCEPVRPVDGKLHLVLDFAIDEERTDDYSHLPL